MVQYKIIKEKIQEERKIQEEIKRCKIEEKRKIEEEKHIKVKITKDNIDIEKLKDIGYNDAFISEILNPEEKGTKYYFPK